MGPLVARVEPYALVGLSPGTHLGMPSAHLTLVLTLDAPLELSGGPIGPDRHRLRVSLAGLHTTPVSIHHEGRMRGIQLALTPAGCRALLACPAGELAKRVVEGGSAPPTTQPQWARVGRRRLPWLRERSASSPTRSTPSGPAVGLGTHRRAPPASLVWSDGMSRGG